MDAIAVAVGAARDGSKGCVQGAGCRVQGAGELTGPATDDQVVCNVAVVRAAHGKRVGYRPAAADNEQPVSQLRQDACGKSVWQTCVWCGVVCGACGGGRRHVRARPCSGKACVDGKAAQKVAQPMGWAEGGRPNQ